MEGNPEKGEKMFEKTDNRNPYFNYFKALTLKANGKKEKRKQSYQIYQMKTLVI